MVLEAARGGTLGVCARLTLRGRGDERAKQWGGWVFRVMGGRERGGGKELGGSESTVRRKGKQGQPGRGWIGVALNAPSWVGR